VFNFTVIPGAIFNASLVQTAGFGGDFASLFDGYSMTGANMTGFGGTGAGFGVTGVTSTGIGDYSIFLAASGAARYRVTIEITQAVAAETVPEPSTYALGLIGMSGLGLICWCKRRRG
jgi:hypothetical protein